MKFRNENNEWQNIRVQNYGIEQTPIGSMIYYPSLNIPDGYLLCDGREVLIADYPLLFNAIGYIGGDDVLTGYFRLPDMQGVVPGGFNPNLLGIDHPLAGEFGDQVGSPRHALTVEELASHHHGVSDDLGTDMRYTMNLDWGTNSIARRMVATSEDSNITAMTANLDAADSTGTGDIGQAAGTGYTGEGQEFSIVQPTKLYNWIIKAKNIVTLGGYTEDFEVAGDLNVLGKLNINNNSAITFNGNYSGDCDDITETSIVWVQNGTNCPPQVVDGNYGSLTTIKVSDNYISQTFIDANNCNQYLRVKINGIWRAWQWVNSKNALTVRATENQSITDTTRTVVQFQAVAHSNGNQLHLVDGGIQIGYGIKKVKVSCNIWAQSTSGYSWVVITRRRPSTNGSLEVAHNIIATNHTEGYRTHSVASTLVDVAMGDIIEASIKFNAASEYNSLNGGSYYGSVQLTVEEV